MYCAWNGAMQIFILANVQHRNCEGHLIDLCNKSFNLSDELPKIETNSQICRATNNKKWNFQIYNFSCQNRWTFSCQNRRLKPIYTSIQIHFEVRNRVFTQMNSIRSCYRTIVRMFLKKKSTDCDLLRAWKQYFLIAEHQTHIKWQFIVWCVSKSVFELRARWCYILSIPLEYVCACVYKAAPRDTFASLLCLFDALFDSDGPCTDCGIL